MNIHQALSRQRNIESRNRTMVATDSFSFSEIDKNTIHLEPGVSWDTQKGFCLAPRFRKLNNFHFI